MLGNSPATPAASLQKVFNDRKREGDMNEIESTKETTRHKILKTRELYMRLMREGGCVWFALDGKERGETWAFKLNESHWLSPLACWEAGRR